MSNKKPADANAAETEASAAAATAAQAAKARIKAIMTSDEAKGRESLAEHFAYDTDMSAEDAIAAMSKAPKAAAEGEASGGDANPAAIYEQSRLLATGQAQPSASASKPKATINRSEIYASRRRLAKEG